MRNRGAPVKETTHLISRYYRYFNAVKTDKKVSKSRKITDQEVCGFLSKDKNFKKEFPDLSSITPRRLQNLMVKARKMRRERILYFCGWYRIKKTNEDVADDDENYVSSGMIMGDPPPWSSVYPSKMFEKYKDL